MTGERIRALGDRAAALSTARWEAEDGLGRALLAYMVGQVAQEAQALHREMCVELGVEAEGEL